MPGSADCERAILLRDTLVDSAQAYLDSVGHRVAMRGQAAVEAIASTRWDAATWSLSAVLTGPSGARMRLLFDPETTKTAACSVVCSCALERCVHGFALAQFLVDTMDAKGSPLAASVMASFGPESWQHGLEQLRAIVDEHATDHAEEHPALRAVFRLVGERRRGQLRLSLQCYLQAKSPSNAGSAWSPGKRLRWAQWSSQAELERDPLTDAVERMLSGQGSGARRKPLPQVTAIENEDWLASASLLEHLVGSTRVAWHDDPRRVVAIERGQLKIEVLPAGDRVRLRIALAHAELRDLGHVARIDARHIARVSRDRRRVVVSSGLPTGLVRGLSALLLGDRRFPRAALSGLVRDLSRLTGSVRAEVLHIDPQLVGRSEPGDARPLVELEALQGGGISLRICAAPHALAQTHEPGEGPETLHVEHGREFVSLQRDLAQERARALELAQVLGLLVGDDPSDRRANWGWTLTAIDRSLQCLAVLRDQGERVRTHWYGGQAVSVSPPVETGSLVLRINRRPGWFDFTGGVAGQDGAEVGLQQLLEAAVAGRHFVEVQPDRWLALSGDLVAHLRTLDEFTQQKGAKRTLRDPAMVAFADLLDPQIELDACVEWHERMARLRNPPELKTGPVVGLAADLRGYQREGVQWLRRMAALGLGVCLADDMGLGKTVQTLALLVERAALGPAIVVAPLSVTDNWAAESGRFAADLKITLYRGASRHSGLDDAGAGSVFVMSYAVFQRDITQLGERRWATLVLDEAQAIKNPTTKVARAARDLAADWKLALTGTPLENRLSDLWSLCRVLVPGLLGSLRGFNDHFVTPIERYDDRRRAGELARVVRPFILRRTKEQVLRDLPALSQATRFASPDPEERRLYELHRRKLVDSLASLRNSGDRRMSVLAGLTQLRQLACHPALVVADWKRSSAKLDVLMELVEELAQAGHAALIFSQFTRHLDLISAALTVRGLSSLRLDGTMSARQRVAAIDGFQAGKSDLMLISLKAGGTGLNLTRASYVILCDPWWNPAVEDQAAGRAHRIGQAGKVHCVRLITRGSVEERVLQVHADKRELVESMLEGTRQAGNLELEELIDLLG